MPVLKRCDLFVLPSLYEGLPVTIQEADTLGLPVCAADIPMLHDFMIENNGWLMPGTKEGVLAGLEAFAQGKVKPMKIDFEERNRAAVARFQELYAER